MQAPHVQHLHQTDLRKYLPHVLIATAVVSVMPLALGYLLSRGGVSSIISIVASVAVSLGLGRAGAAMWQRNPGSSDLVFDDLMIWGYVRRMWGQKRAMKSLERLAYHLPARSRRSGRQERARQLKTLASALEQGDPFTHGHSQRVSRHSYRIAKAMKLPKDDCDRIRLAGAIHDVGKLRVPHSIINKPGALSTLEYAVVKQHPSIGAEMVEVLGDPELTRIVRHHHERLDGSGYPHRLAGPQIPVGASIVAVVDVFDAMTSRRPYRAASKHVHAIEVLKKEAGVRLDRDAVRGFLLYYEGRRAIRSWSFVSAGFQRLGDLLASLGVQRTALASVMNVAAVGGTAAVLATSAIAHPQSPDRHKVPPHHGNKHVAAVAEAGGKDNGLHLGHKKHAEKKKAKNAKGDKTKSGHEKDKGAKGEHTGPKNEKKDKPGAASSNKPSEKNTKEEKADTGSDAKDQPSAGELKGKDSSDVAEDKKSSDVGHAEPPTPESSTEH